MVGITTLAELVCILTRSSDGWAIAVEISKRDFTADERGTMLFQAHAAYSASNWVTATPDQFALGPGATQDIGVRITLPSQPEPGDHQVALVFVVPAGTEATNIRVNRGVGTPLFIAVPGPLDTSTTIEGPAHGAKAYRTPPKGPSCAGKGS